MYSDKAEDWRKRNVVCNTDPWRGRGADCRYDSEMDYFFALGEEEKRLVERIGNQVHKIPLSQIMIGEGKQIQVLEGPLKGYVGNIVKVNLHKREAAIEIEFMGRKMELKMGIEMVGTGENSPRK